MKQLKAFRIFFLLAALLFVAKPFLGFRAFYGQSHPRIEHSVLVKSFTKRKPESLEEADKHARYIHHILTDPLAVIFSAISLLLLALFPKAFSSTIKITGSYLSGIRLALLPPEHTYLLAGKLII